MRTVGHRKEPPISFAASPELLVAGARFNDEIHRLPTGQTTRVRKGLYRFRTHEEANRQQIEAIVESVVLSALHR